MEKVLSMLNEMFHTGSMVQERFSSMVFRSVGVFFMDTVYFMEPLHYPDSGASQPETLQDKAGTGDCVLAHQRRLPPALA